MDKVDELGMFESSAPKSGDFLQFFFGHITTRKSVTGCIAQDPLQAKPPIFDRNLQDHGDLDLVNDPSSTGDITFHLRRLCIISAQ